MVERCLDWGLIGVALAVAGSMVAYGGGAPKMRPPAVPLVVHDPYFSIWSCSDSLAADWPRHWTGAIHALCSMVRVDGRPYRLMGMELRDAPPMPQTGLRVTPTRSIYEFEGAGVRIQLTFLSPLLPHDLELVGRPASYLTWQVTSTDGKEHQVSLYYDNSAELVVDKPEQPVAWSRLMLPELEVLCFGSEEQSVLAKKGDNLRIDWGYLYVAAPFAKGIGLMTAIADHKTARGMFASDEILPKNDDARMPRAAKDDWPVIACAYDLGKVGAQPASRHLILAYDDLYSIEFLGQKLRPWWRRNGAEAKDLLAAAAKDYAEVVRRCEAFDADLMADLAKVGGADYADFCSLAYRQAIGAHKLVAAPRQARGGLSSSKAAPDGRPMLFSKECFSNGCIATVDVMYPASPIFAFLNVELLKASTTPILDYAATERWKFPFAPHDLGTYPQANGQVYGGGERTEANQMPVEESGNLLILAALISQLDGNTAYAQRYWPQLERWARYLKEKGLDPENQLCTDDFAGHLAHNANLSLKAIVALAAYARMCEMTVGGASAPRDVVGGPSPAREERGAETLRLQSLRKEAEEYRKLAESFANQWAKLADEGDHYRLAFDRPGTWSQKYNLVWDKLLGLGLFPPEIARKEIAYYKTKLNRYGLPLDNRQTYTKTDWEVWTATLAERREDWEALMKPVYDFVSATPQRVPLTDWYWTLNAHKRGFQARPVIGGVFVKMLSDPAVWKKWSPKPQ